MARLHGIETHLAILTGGHETPAVDPKVGTVGGSLVVGVAASLGATGCVKQADAGVAKTRAEPAAVGGIGEMGHHVG